MKNLPWGIRVTFFCLLLAALGWLGHKAFNYFDQVRVLKKMVQRLSADSRAAEVLVTRTELDEASGKIKTTIKFLEYDAGGRPVSPNYFTFEGNIIQFQALVIRFEDKFVLGGDKLRGKSAYLFTKAFVLDGPRTQEFEITPLHSIPAGYKIPGEKSKFETALWEKFWKYALDPKERERSGIKNAQIEAPGSMFLPGTIYTLKIEHDGGFRIDTRPVPEILKGEQVS